MNDGLARRRDLQVLGAIAVLAFLLRLVSLAAYESTHPLALVPVIDEASYDAWARRIAGGDWLGGGEVWFQEPLYSYTLAVVYKLFGATLHAARVAQCAWWALTAFLCGLVARRLFGGKAAWLTAALVAVWSSGMVFPALLLKENLFLPLFAATCVLLVVSRSLDGWRALGAWALLGLAVGAGALLRGNMLLLAPAFVAWPVARALLRRERVARSLALAAAAVLGVAAALLPVLWRNHEVGGVWVLTTSGAGTNLYGGNNAENPWGRATEFSFVRGVPAYEAGDWNREAERRLGRELDPKETSDYWLGETLASARRDPLLHLSILWNKLRLTLGAYEVPDNHMIEWDARHVPLARWLPSWGLYGMLGLAGVLLYASRTWRGKVEWRAVRCPGGARELALVFVLYLGTIVLTVTSDRARLPLLVPLAPFAAWFLVELHAAWRARAKRLLLGGAAALAVAAAAVHAPALPAGEREQDFDEREYNLAVVLRDQPGREGEARELALAVAERRPRSARVRLLVAELDFRKAARAQDAAALRELAQRGAAWCASGELVPRERFRACALEAWCRLELGEGRAALAAFESARGFDPDDVQLRRGAARALLLLAEAEEAARLQHADEALRVLRGAGEGPETRLLRAQAGFERARATPRWGNSAADAVQDVLDELEALAKKKDGPEAVDRGLRAEARRLAGWIQLWLGNPRAASNHFRAALDLGDAGTAELGLVSALLSRVEAGESAPELLQEADLRLARLASGGGAAVDELRARRARLSPAPR